jgi:hypothetical protein
MKNRTKWIAVSVASALVLATVGVVLANTSTHTSCITTYVDFGVLKNHETQTSCVAVSGSKHAPDVLRAAGFTLTGTDKYGEQIVCRLNNLPGATTPVPVSGHSDYIEHCTDMPAEFAYWAVLVKRGGVNPLDLNTRWGWAQTGVKDLVLKPGDSVGLVFTDNDKTRFPN